jgi:hypothetical protein
VVVAGVIGALVVQAIYTTRLLEVQDSESRWAFVENKRVRQREAEAKIAMDTVTLALMDERHPPSAMRSASLELRSALTYHLHRLRLAQRRAEAADADRGGERLLLASPVRPHGERRTHHGRGHVGPGRVLTARSNPRPSSRRIHAGAGAAAARS